MYRFYLLSRLALGFHHLSYFSQYLSGRGERRGPGKWRAYSLVEGYIDTRVFVYVLYSTLSHGKRKIDGRVFTTATNSIHSRHQQTNQLKKKTKFSIAIRINTWPNSLSLKIKWRSQK